MSNCLNFRDVGEWLTVIAGRELLPPRRLLRGGKLDLVQTPDEIGHPGTIINLRRGPDRETFGADHHQIAIPNSYEKYDTTDRVVRRWLNDVAIAVAQARAFPVMLHCTSGKDRTGVAVALLLCAIDVPREVVIEEYLLSEGEVEQAWIERALDGIGDVRAYLERVDLRQLARNLRGAQP
jgi:protein-tyrosine phosphatase